MSVDVPDLLDEFAKRPGCERYRTDGNKLDLLLLYLLVRQFAPDVVFEEFLSRLEPVAGYDEENALLPVDAVALFCPRSKSRAEQLQRTQWSAAQVVDFLAYYVDGVRTGSLAKVPMRQYIEQGSVMYLKGDFGRIAAGPSTGGKAVGDKPVKSKEPRKAKADDRPVGVPAVVGQPAILTLYSGRQCRCMVQRRYPIADSAAELVTVLTREGELVQGMPLAAVEFDPTPVDEPASLYAVSLCEMPSAQAEAWQEQLLTRDRITPDTSGTILDTYSCQLSEQLLVRLSLQGSSTGPCVIPYLLDVSSGQEELVQVLQPRELSVYGEYAFRASGETGDRVLQLPYRLPEAAA